MKRIISIVLALLMLVSLSITSFAISQEEAAAKDLGKYGIMGGFPDGTLRLQNNVTRAQAAKMVVTAQGRQDIFNDPYMADYPSPFKDIDSKHWAYSCVRDAAMSRFINGFADGTFRPDENITNEQIIKIIVCALEYDHYDNQVVDPSEILSYPQDYIDIARKLKLTEGLDFKVGQPATRGFIATVLSRALDIPLVEGFVVAESQNPAILWKEFAFKIMDGTNGNELKTLRRKLEGIVK